MGKKLDLSQFEKPVVNYLKPKEQVKVKKPIKATKGIGGKVKKIGRPMISDEPLNIPVSVNFSATEYNKIKENSGIAAVSAFIRESLKKAGII